MKKSTVAAVAVLVFVLAAGLLAGCAKKAPQLTQEQLMAGVIPAKHPVDQEQASAQGCACHLQK